jgi:hypothetical protein
LHVSQKLGRWAFLTNKFNPKYIFLIFLWAAVYPLVLALLWSPATSELGTALFALAVASLFGAWLFIDNERSVKESVANHLFKSWLASCAAFAVLSASVELISPNPHWYPYVLSVCGFVGHRE